MNLINECPQCGEIVNTIHVFLDSLGFHMICPKCGSSFDVDINEKEDK